MESCRLTPIATPRRGRLLAAAICLLWLTPPAHAHHAFAGEYDVAKRVEFTGTVTRVLWVNPHASLFLDVDGTHEEWQIELGSPGTLIARGTTKEMLVPGVWLQLTAYRARDGSRRASARAIRLGDGRSPFYSDAVLALLIALAAAVIAVIVRYLLEWLLRLVSAHVTSARALLRRVRLAPVIVQWVLIALGTLLALTGALDVRG